MADLGKRNIRFLSTLSLRRATQTRAAGSGRCAISIHALLAESDLRACRVWSRRRYFYPRSPCGERRNHGQQGPAKNYFYPRSPCGERRPSAGTGPRFRYFYPRSPCGERPHDAKGPGSVFHFYPRSPCGERPFFHYL